MPSIALHHVWQYTDFDRDFWREHLESWLPQRIFDAHTHITEPKFRLETMSEEKRRQYWVNEVYEPIGAENTHHCGKVLYPNRDFSCLAFGDPLLEIDIESNNDHLERECEKFGWQKLAIVLPQWTADRVARELDQPRTKGFKVYYSLIENDPISRDKHLEASIFAFLPHHQLEVLNDRRGWLTLHVPKADRLSHPDNIREIKEIRRRYPQVKLVVAHLGRNYVLPHAETSLPQLADDEGIYFDLSAVFNPEVLGYAFKLIGPKRLIFGTDHPIFYMRGRQRWYGTKYVNHTNYPFHYNTKRESPANESKYTIFTYESLFAIKQAAEATGLNREDVEAIIHGNAERLLAAIP
jgi:hypothetical protein